jgi:hypothetical protein
VHRASAARFDLGESFFFEGGYHNFISLRSRCIEHEKRELAIAGNQAEACHERTEISIKISTI